MFKEIFENRTTVHKYSLGQTLRKGQFALEPYSKVSNIQHEFTMSLYSLRIP